MKTSIISLLTIHLFLLRKIKKIKMKEKLITDINVSSFLHWKVLRTQFVYVIIRVLFMPSAIQNPRNWSSVETYNGKNGAFQNNKIWISF